MIVSADYKCKALVTIDNYASNRPVATPFITCWDIFHLPPGWHQLGLRSLSYWSLPRSWDSETARRWGNGPSWLPELGEVSDIMALSGVWSNGVPSGAGLVSLPLLVRGL